MIVEGHTAMRFAWLRKNTAKNGSVNQGSTRTLGLIRKAYNLVFWIFLLPFFTTMSYGTGFIAFTVLIFVRLGANIYINFLKLNPDQFDRFPFRIA
ncbi:MAG: hypothetical protein JRF71_14905 [Deltaproteobacteria bacterium]|nr:hypothetical protein [Deltaproteobacteria bacterium]